jgi:hypothetical protein
MRNWRLGPPRGNNQTGTGTRNAERTSMMSSRSRSLIQWFLVAVCLAFAPGRAHAHAHPQNNYLDYKSPDWYFLGKYEYNPKENYEVTPHKAVGTIPADVLALSGKKLRIYGILKPLDLKDGYATHFVLIATVDVCGFGVTPRINERIDVLMAPGTKWKAYASNGLDLEASVFGTFTIKEVLDKDNQVLDLYHLVADKIE